MTNRSEEREKEILSEIETYLAPAYLPPFLKFGGHDVTHVLNMQKIAEKIWPVLETIPGIKEAIKSGEVTLFLIKTAIWLHNLDRTSKFGEQSESITIRKILQTFPEIQEEEIQIIADAVLNHSRRSKQKGDHPLLCVLRYCDMLDMGAVGIGRIFSHNYSKGNLPHVLEDFESETIKANKEGRLRSALEAILWCLNGQDFFPQELLKMEFVQKRFAFMKHFRETYIQELKELGIA